MSDRIFSNVQIGNTSLSDAKAKLPTSKTSSLEQWEQFIASYIPLMQLTLNTWKRRVIRKTSFWCYGKRDKCLDTLCKKITGGERGTLVAFGGAAACSTGCGYAPVPQKRLRSRLQKIHGARISLIEERYTSQICSQCQGRLKDVHIQGEEIWALKKCTSCQTSNGTDLIWNRDRNASLNILQIYLNLAECGLRPSAFSKRSNSHT